MPLGVLEPAAGGSYSMWQSIGGLVAVFGLLIVSLKFLGRFQRRGASRNVSILAVWALGPRREIQVLRLETEVHYIYRCEGSMVLLKQESLDQWEAQRAADPQTGPNAGRLSSLLQGRLPSLATGGSGFRPDLP